MENYYETLGVKNSASFEEIKAAYKSLAKKYHPDKHQGDKYYEDQFKKINSAYQTISDPQKRRLYDLKLHYYFTPPQKPAKAPTNSSSKQRTSRQPRPKPATTQESKVSNKEVRIYLYTGLALILLVVASVLFYHYMNNRMAAKTHEEAIQYEKDGEWLKALESYTESISFDEDYAPAFQKRALLRLHMLGDYRGAVLDLTKAIENTENPSWDLYYERGKANAKIKKNSAALEDFNESIKRNPAKDSSYLYRGELLQYAKGDCQSAYPDYLKFLKHQPESEMALLNLANCYQELDQHQKSISIYTDMIKKQQNPGIAHYYRGLAYSRIVDSTNACSDFTKALEYDVRQAKKLHRRYCLKINDEED
ncbi:MAG: DnaJ domain-containing protein [Sporocytophaga sp.]|uniref:J domain-containing protein n=1 Tax=Sporocytophaga sp. TaxID=2231183 RepID=UPI001B1EC11B|nr:DnaJ domain-containing protein [Sporocytophaga sp.]MBO9701237.1 DnaJ domain-containing protein [Sporocytophaga sp.]